MTPVLLTERLLLRPFEHEDAQALAVLLDHADVATGVCATPVPFTPLHAAARILMMRAAEGRGDLAWAVEDGSGELVGLVTLERRDGQALQLGVAVARPRWGQGIATEALEAALDWVGRARPGATVCSEVFADTDRVHGLLARLGFRPIGGSRRFSLARQRSDAVQLWQRLAA